jgi:hypothetical protein
MSTETPNAEESIAPGHGRPRVIVVGQDRTGADHVYHTPTERVIVVADDGVERVESVNPPGRDHDIHAWMAYVADERGWVTRDLHDGLGDALSASAGGER